MTGSAVCTSVERAYQLNRLFDTAFRHVHEAAIGDRDGYAFLYLRCATTKFTPDEVHVIGAALASVVVAE